MRKQEYGSTLAQRTPNTRMVMYGMVLLDSLGRLMLSSPTSRGDIAVFS